MKNICETFEKYGIKISKHQAEQFDKYYNRLVETNKVMNLTAITDEGDVLLKHFLDSVLPCDMIKQNSTLIDVGAGAGFPSLPLKIVRSDIKLTMIDSLNKRVNFLNDVVNDLSLKGVTAEHARAEEFAKTHREKFDVATARAVAELNTLVEYLLPFVKVGGICLIYKASKLDEEIARAEKAINLLGGKIDCIKKYKIDEIEAERNVLIIKKVSKTPLGYPRDKNRPRLKPIT